jgi:tRNA (cytosine38-C5)-methyltransferase
MDIRYFTPYEIARLHGFPVGRINHLSFEFPPGVETMQQYRLLGNSLSVTVVSRLLEGLLF